MNNIQNIKPNIATKYKIIKTHCVRWWLLSSLIGRKTSSGSWWYPSPSPRSSPSVTWGERNTCHRYIQYRTCQYRSCQYRTWQYRSWQYRTCQYKRGNIGVYCTILENIGSGNLPICLFGNPEVLPILQDYYTPGISINLRFSSLSW